tara:strand:+ start:1751 stop:4138 length:2388 start_codon:yes stop_codon:yes gene_type:complete
MPYIGRTKSNNIRTQRFIADGVRKIYTTEFIPVSDNQLSIYIDGVYLNDQDFVFKHPNKVMLSDAPAQGAEVIIQALKASEYQSVRSKTYVANGSQRIFSCGFTPPDEYSIIVTKNGDILQDKDYVIQGSKVIFTQMPSTDTEIEIRGIYDVIDPSGNAQASNTLAIKRTRQITDGFQNIVPMHQKNDNDNNLLVFRGGASASLMSNHNEYSIVNDYKYVHESRLLENVPIEFRGLKGTTYTNLSRRVMMAKHISGVPTTINTTPTAAGTSGYANGNNLEARGGSGQGFRVNITTSGGQVTGVAINTDLGGGDFAYNYQANEVLTIYQAGSSNDATVTITVVTDRGGQKYFDVNNHIWDITNNVYQKETTYTLSTDEADLIVSVDGIIQPFNAYTVESDTFNDGNSAAAQVVNIGSYVGVDDTASKIEIRDLKELVSNADAVLLADTVISRAVWVSNGSAAAFNTASGTESVHGSFTNLAANVANEECFLVIVDGIIQDRDTWSINSTTLTVGANPGSSDQSVKVELIYFETLIPSGSHNTQDCLQVTMTGNASTGIGDHQFIRLLDRATGLKQIHPSSDDCVIVDINGVYQHDDAYFITENKLCFYDTVDNPAFGSIINVKVLKGTEVAATARRKVQLRGTGSATQFTLPFTSTTTPKDFGILAIINGKVLRDDEYALASTTLTFNTAPANDAFIEVQGIFDVTTYAGSSSATDLETKKLVFNANGSQQIYDLGELIFEKHSYGTIQDSYNEQKLLVFHEGELQDPTKYIIVGNKLYLTTIPTNDTKVEVVRFI